MNGIKMSDCKFYVDEEARVVICVIPETSYMLRDFIYDNFQFKDVDFWDATNWNMTDTTIMPHSFMGKAVCSKDDEWNEDTGRLIAYQRAKDKCYKSFFKRANTFVQAIDRRLNDIITAFNDMGDKLSDRNLEIQQKIDKALGVNDEE